MADARLWAPADRETAVRQEGAFRRRDPGTFAPFGRASLRHQAVRGSLGAAEPDRALSTVAGTLRPDQNWTVDPQKRRTTP